MHGADTSQPEGKTGSPVAAAAKPVLQTETIDGGNKVAMTLTQKYSCTACHAVDKGIVGPNFMDIAKKHAGETNHLAAKIKPGGSGVWRSIPMPPQALDETGAKTLAAWLASGAGK